MIHPEFVALCLDNLVDPAIALENEDLVKALKQKDDVTVKNIIETEF